MYGSATAAPPMTYCRTRAPSASNYQLQIDFVFDSWHKTIIVVWVNCYRQGQSPFSTPIPTQFKIRHFPPCHLAQPGVNVITFPASIMENFSMLWTHGYNHI